MNTPMVSVIMPVYNAHLYVAKANIGVQGVQTR